MLPVAHSDPSARKESQELRLGGMAHAEAARISGREPLLHMKGRCRHFDQASGNGNSGRGARRAM